MNPCLIYSYQWNRGQPLCSWYLLTTGGLHKHTIVYCYGDPWTISTMYYRKQMSLCVSVWQRERGGEGIGRRRRRRRRRQRQWQRQVSHDHDPFILLHSGMLVLVSFTGEAPIWKATHIAIWWIPAVWYCCYLYKVGNKIFPSRPNHDI